MQKYLILLLSTPILAAASIEFAAEMPIEHPDKMPTPVITHLNHQLAQEIKRCEIKNIEEAFEGQSIKLSARSNAYFVKPKNWCLCSAYYCPMWMFKVNGQSAHQLWSTQGTGILEVLDKKTNGYRRIKELGGVLTHGHSAIWA